MSNDMDDDILLDDTCKYIVERILEKTKEMNIDWFLAIVGGEGVGKSTLAINIFSYICKLCNYDPETTLHKTLIYDEDELLEYIANIDIEKKYLPIILDEGANILFNRESINKKRSYILKFFNVMRFLNNIVIISTPNITFIDKNVRTHRLKSIFYIPSRSIYWYYDKSQIERMLQSETPKKWFWLEPSYIGTYGVNKKLEQITNQIKLNYVHKFSHKIKLKLQTKQTKPKPKPQTHKLYPYLQTPYLQTPYPNIETEGE